MPQLCPSMWTLYYMIVMFVLYFMLTMIYFMKINNSNYLESFKLKNKTISNLSYLSLSSIFKSA
uniref:ATP synthase F0 subunit 8 n=1 Tax=Pediculus humanus subsp. corporis TaxID=121224 RepID=X2D2D1_PEDHC|nr:ATP synthase F0 subunit 8 [Pediculus humanus corporis]